MTSVAATAMAAATMRPLRAQPADEGRFRAEVLRYLRLQARSDGGFAFAEQSASHLTATYAAVGALRLLDALPSDRSSLIAFIHRHHPRELKRKEHERRSFDFQQVQALSWLGDPGTDLRDTVQGFIAPRKYNPYFEKHGYPVFQFEVGTLQCRRLLGLPLDAIAPAFLEYILPRRRANGSFNNTPADEGGDGHVMNTWWGLQALDTLGHTEDKPAKTIEWLQACQRPAGGFTYQPTPMVGGVEDVAYTRAAILALRHLGGEPLHREACIAWLRSLANADGGFGDRPGWDSNVLATFYALDALAALSAVDALASLRRPVARPRSTLPAGLHVYSMQIQAHGTGSPAEAVALARALKIDFWGAKNAKPAWLSRARAIAAGQGAAVQFFPAIEEHGTWLQTPGLGTYSHTSDVMAPAGAEMGASLANQPPVTWAEYRERRLAPLHRGGGRLLWQFGENEELVRALLDESCESGGFSGISTFHYSNPDFTNTEPFLFRWRGRIPFVSLQDAHGPEPWWFADFTTGHRTLFLGREATWAAWLEALEKNWTVAVRHDAMSGGRTWMHSGSSAVLQFVQAREKDWRWWGEAKVRRPLVSIVPLTPSDEFEAARPESGVTLRIRCAWSNTEGGQPALPLAELVRLEVDGRTVAVELVETKRANGTDLADHYYLWRADSLPPGRHAATVFVRELADGREETQAIAFDVSG